ncbi:MAG: HAMP domain-containing histidine kinase [Erysipelothrix sp.]|nr:HAMP domain-containing histidine kinase [Erysipelothrix sp.]
MKHIKNFIKRMPLTQQLLFMVVSISMFLISFFFGFMALSVDTFVENQMFNIIHDTQEGVIENYLLGKTGPSLFGSDVSDMVHIIYVKDSIPLISTNTNIEDTFPGIYKMIEEELSKFEGDRLDKRIEKSGLISFKNINESSEIVTIMPIEYHNEFKTALLNTFVYIIVMVISAVFIFMLYWVGTIIHPLNQIKEYIEKRNEHNPGTLKIDREDEIGDLARVLLKMEEELEFQQAQKEEMLQNISHDLKTPVATIKSYSEAIKDGIYPYETLEKSVDVIIEHAERLEKKIYNLLMLNRMDYMTHEEIDVNEVIHMEPIVNQVILSSKQIRPEIEIIFECDGDHFQGQEEPWRVVIENLLDNALRYSKTKVVIEMKDNYVSIYNDGEKVSQKRIDAFFQPYEMGDKGQFGLGLAIVHRVVTNYKYTIEASNQEEGVIFVISK